MALTHDSNDTSYVENADPELSTDETFEPSSSENTLSPLNSNSFIDRLVSNARQTVISNTLPTSTIPFSIQPNSNVEATVFRQSPPADYTIFDLESETITSFEPDDTNISNASALTLHSSTTNSNTFSTTPETDTPDRNEVPVKTSFFGTTDIGVELALKSVHGSNSFTPSRECNNCQIGLNFFEQDTTYEESIEELETTEFQSFHNRKFSLSPEPIGDKPPEFADASHFRDFQDAPGTFNNVFHHKEQAIKRKLSLDQSKNDSCAAKRQDTKSESTLEIYRSLEQPLVDRSIQKNRSSLPPISCNKFVKEVQEGRNSHVFEFENNADSKLQEDRPSLDSLPFYENFERIQFQPMLRSNNRSAIILEKRRREMSVLADTPLKEKQLLQTDHYNFSRFSKSPEGDPVEEAHFGRSITSKRPSEPKSPSPSKSKNKLYKNFVREAARRGKKIVCTLLGIDVSRHLISQKLINHIQMNIIEAIKLQKYGTSFNHQASKRKDTSMIYQWVKDLTKYEPKPMLKSGFRKFILESFVPAKCSQLWKLELSKFGDFTNKIFKHRIQLGKIQKLMASNKRAVKYDIGYKILMTSKFSELMCGTELDDETLILAVTLISSFLYDKGGYLLFLKEKTQLKPHVGDIFEKSKVQWLKYSGKDQQYQEWTYRVLSVINNCPQLYSFGTEMLSRINDLKSFNFLKAKNSVDTTFEVDFNAYFKKPSRRAEFVKTVIKSVVKSGRFQKIWIEMPLTKACYYRPIVMEWLFRWVLIVPEVFVFFNPYAAFNANSVYAEQLLAVNRDEDEYKNQVAKTTTLLNYYSAKINHTHAPEVIEMIKDVHDFVMDNRKSYIIVKEIFERMHVYPKMLRLSLGSFIDMNSPSISIQDQISITDLMPLAKRIFNTPIYPCVEYGRNRVVDNPNPRPMQMQEKYVKLVKNVATSMHNFIKTIPLFERSYFVLTHPLMNTDYHQNFKNKISEVFFNGCSVSDLFELNSYAIKVNALKTMESDFWNQCKLERGSIINKVLAPPKEFNGLKANEKLLEVSIRDLFTKHFVQLSRTRRSIPDEINLYIYAAIFAKHANGGDYEKFLNALFLDLKLDEKKLASDECYSDLDFFKNTINGVLSKVQDDIIERWKFDGLRLPSITTPIFNIPSASKNFYAKYLIFCAAMVCFNPADMQKVVSLVQTIPKHVWKQLFNSMFKRDQQAVQIIDAHSSMSTCDGIFSDANVPSAWKKIYITTKCIFGTENHVITENILLWYYNFSKMPEVADAVIQMGYSIRAQPEVRKFYGFTTEHIHCDFGKLKKRLVSSETQNFYNRSMADPNVEFEYDSQSSDEFSSVNSDADSNGSAVSNLDLNFCDTDSNCMSDMSLQHDENDYPNTQELCPLLQNHRQANLQNQFNSSEDSFCSQESETFIYIENYVKLFAHFQNILIAELPKVQQIICSDRFNLLLTLK